MALQDKNIVITPNIGQTSDPKIVFSGADATTSAQNINLQVYPTSNGTLSFEGSAGQLFSISNSLSGTLFSVNDVSGIPSIEVLDTGEVKIAQYNGSLTLGTTTASNLTVTGNLTINGTTTTVNSSVMTIDDPIITLGGDIAPTSDDNKDRGIEFRYHNGTTAKVGFFGFDDSTGKFTFIPDATNTSEVFSGTKGTLDANIEWADVLNKPTIGTGTVTSVALGLPSSIFTVSGSPITSSGTLTGTLATQSGATVFAGPVADTSAPTAIAPTFRNLELTDIPGAAFKKSVRVATTAALTLNAATATIDGITLAASDRVLIKDQATASQNGIYYNVTTASWARCVDSDAAGEIANATVAVDEGTTNGGKLFRTTFKSTDTLGTTAMNWYEVLDNSKLSSTTPANISTTGSVGTGTTLARADHVHALPAVADSGTGTFKKITVDSYGRVTGTAAVAQADITGLLGAGSITSTMLSTVTDSGTGTFKKITVDSYGRVTGTAAVAQADITGLLGASSITNTMLATVGPTKGGTGLTTYVAGDVLYASAADTLARLAKGTAKQVLSMNDAGTFPQWSTIDMSYLPDSVLKKSVKAASTADIAASLWSTNVYTGYSNTQTLALTTTAGNTTITTTSTAGLKVGAVVSTATTQVAAGTTVATITNGTTFTVNNRTNITTTAITGNGTTATATFAAQTYAPYAVGSSIVVSGATPATYNGAFTVTACTTTSVSWASVETVTATVQGTIAFNIAAGTSISTNFAQTISALSVDGITLALNDRVLIKDQSTLGGIADASASAKNGIYYLSTLGSTSVPWVLTRVLDADSITELASAIVAVDSGTTNGGLLFDNDLKTTDTLNTTAVNWHRVIDAGYTIPATQGGTGQTTYAIGDLLYASSTTALSKLADVATGNALISGGVNTAPSWGKIGLTTHVSGTLPVANGGTGVTTASGATVFAGPVADTSAPTAIAPTFRNLEMTDIPGAAFKKSVRVATTAALTLNAATASIDGVTLAATDRVLIKDQATASQNGIYYNVTTASWARCVDSDAASEIANGIVAVDEGTTNGGKLFRTTFKSTDTLGTTAMNWYEVLTSLNGQPLDADLTSIAGLAGTSGFLKKTGTNTWALDTNTYLTSYTESDTLATVTGRGASTGTAITLSNATGSSSPSTGALIVSAGGVGVSGNINAGGYITAVSSGSAGQIQAIGGSASTWYNSMLRNDGSNVYLLSSAVQTTSALATNATWNTYRPFSWNLSTGAVSIASDGSATSVGGNLTVTGNLTINGTTTTVNSTTVTIDDPIFTLGGDVAPTSDDNKDRGIEFRYHNGTAAKVGFFGFDDSTGKFTFIPDATNTSEVFAGTAGTISANVLESTVAIGTAPLTVTSTTAVTNLNADLLDGYHHGSFLKTSTNQTYSGGVLTVSNDAGALGSTTSAANTLQIFQATSGSDAFQTFHVSGDHAVHFGLDGTTNDLFVGGWSLGAVKNKIWHAGNDGASSGLDADMVDGKHVGTSGNAIPLMDGTNTWSGKQAFQNVFTIMGVEGSAQYLEFGMGTNFPYIDFHSSNTAVDYNARISCAGTTAGLAAGDLTFESASATFTGNLTSQKVVTATKGINPGAMTYPIYEANVDFGASAANTWVKIISASLQNTQYSTVGFIVDIIDPQANHATSTSSNNIIKETYHVACVRTEATTLDTPDACYVYGPSNRLRAIKTATGAYEVQIQNLAQYREYKIRITTYATNGSHTIDYFAGATAGTATATYTASAGSSIDYFQNVNATGAVVSNNHNTTNGNVSSASLTTVNNTAGQVVMSHAIATYRSVQYQIQVTSGSAYHSTIMNVIHDGVSTVYATEYGTIFSGSSLATFDADISGGNLRLLVSPVNQVNTIKVIASAINV